MTYGTHWRGTWLLPCTLHMCKYLPMLDWCRGECTVSIMNINNGIKEPTRSKSNIIKTVTFKQSNVLNWENVFIYPSHCLGQSHSPTYWNEGWLYPGIYHDPWKVDKPYRSFRKQKYPPVPIPTGIKKKKKESSLQVPEWGICVKKRRRRYESHYGIYSILRK